MSYYPYIVIFSGAFLAAVFLTPLVRKIAHATGYVAQPKESRWHKTPTALMGGTAIYFSTLAAWVTAANYEGWAAFGKPYLPILICASAMFCLGLIDDIFNIDPQHKLVGQIIITSALMIFGFKLNWFTSKTLNAFTTVIWVVGITNAFNLLDNMDGLSAGIAFIAGMFLFLNHFLDPGASMFTGPILTLSSAFLGALLGFLLFNFNPASIFMGDAGSLFIGFVMACLTLSGSGKATIGGGFGHLLSVMAVPIFILFIPLLDTGFVSLMRKLFARPISVGGRDHSSHRMVAIGFSERRAVLTLYVFSAFSGIIALAIPYSSSGLALILIGLYLLVVALFWVYLAKVKVYPEDSIVSANIPARGLTPIIVRFTYKRRLFEVSLDFVLITMAYYGAYFLRFEGLVSDLLGANFDFFLKSLPIVIACQIFAFFIMGVYRGIWEATGVRDLIDYVKAVTLGTVMAMLAVVFAYRFESFSRWVFVIYWALLLILISLSRLSFRLLEEGLKKNKKSGKPTLIYGAGSGGQLLMREIENNRDLQLNLIGFLDESPKKQRRRIKGYPVLGDMRDLEKIVRKHKIQEIIISFRKGGERKQEEIKVLCDTMGVRVTRMEIVIK